ncbi:MAG: hypothetical protein HY929_09060 [Euryarchaeota archaeon]|nr:hypothetical protein [Euryarchaeota archaeon]
MKRALIILVLTGLLVISVIIDTTVACKGCQFNGCSGSINCPGRCSSTLSTPTGIIAGALLIPAFVLPAYYLTRR